MDYQLSMLFVSWVIVIFMITGFLMVKLSQYHSNNENSNIGDKERMNCEMFLQMYNECDFIGRVNFITLYGAISWSLALTDWYWNKKQNINKGD